MLAVSMVDFVGRGNPPGIVGLVAVAVAVEGGSMGESVGIVEAGGATPWATQAAKAHSVQVCGVRVQIWAGVQTGHSGARVGHWTQRARRVLRWGLGVRLSLSLEVWGRVRGEERLRGGKERIFIGWSVLSCLGTSSIGCFFSAWRIKDDETVQVSLL